MLIKLRTEDGKHIVTYRGKEHTFNTMRIALVFINLCIKELDDETN